MKWKDLKLNKKFAIAFGSIIVLLIFVAFWSIKGIGGIIGHAEEVINGNKLKANIIQKEVDHLNWANAVSELLNNYEVTTLDVQTDPKQCSFGKWYYSAEREEAEKMIPELKTLFEKIEQPHKHLHESAIEINNNFTQASQELSNTLRNAKSDHLIWAQKVKDVVINNKRVSSINVIKDPTKCNFGKWLYSKETAELRKKYPEFDTYCNNVEISHNKLHKSVIEVERAYRNGNTLGGKNTYINTTKPITNEVLAAIDKMLSWNDNKLSGMQKARAIYTSKTIPNLTSVQNLLKDIIKTTNENVMTDDAMLQEARGTSTGVLIASILITLLAIILAIIIARGIINPINKSVSFASKLASGDLTAKIKIDQEDEIGQLAKALSNMGTKLRAIVDEILTGADNIASASQQMSSTSQEMSQGSSEQASSVEEVSSSMEEMAANIQNNTNNSQQTEKIAINSTSAIREGSTATNTAVESMKNIADKIRIINDIAFQTNILALNAAVEAARAGEHGKGFAVVAAEVRKLAERSKLAADEIDDLSRNGVDIAEQAGNKLTEIVPDIEKTAQLVQEITAASIEQNSGASQINNAMQQLNNVTQQNAAASEELATSSEELASQADYLKEIIRFFNTGNTKAKTADISNTKNNKTKKQIATSKNSTMENLNKVEIKMSEVKEDDEFETF